MRSNPRDHIYIEIQQMDGQKVMKSQKIFNIVQQQSPLLFKYCQHTFSMPSYTKPHDTRQQKKILDLVWHVNA